MNKNYRLVFWNLFGIQMLFYIIYLYWIQKLPNEIIGGIYALIGTMVLLFFWMKYLNSALKSAEKKYSGILVFLLSLVTIIPFGTLIVITIAYYLLRDTEYWKGKNE